MATPTPTPTPTATVLSEDAPISEVLGKFTTYPAAAQLLYEGAMVQDDGSGNAQEITAGNSSSFYGHVVERCDNSSGSEGDKDVKVMAGRYRLEVTLNSVSAGDEGSKVYAVTDQSLTTSSDDGDNQQVGWVEKVTDATNNKAIVQFETLL